MTTAEQAYKTLTPHTQLKLANGLTVLYVQTKNSPIAAGHLFFPVGSVDEPRNQRGLTTLMWSLFLKGTARRNAKRMAEDLEALGAHVSGSCTQEFSIVSFYSLSEYFKQTLDLTLEGLFQPVFHSKEVDKEKKALMAAIRSKKEHIFTVTQEKLNKSFYGAHPYSHPTSGTEESVRSLRPDTLLNWQKQITLPNQAILTLATPLSFYDFFSTLERRFGPNQWESGDIGWKKIVHDPSYKTEPAHLKENTHFEQAFLMMAAPAPSVSAKDYPAMKLINTLLGGGMSARLFQTLREKQGLAYDVGSFFPSKKSGSGFYAYMGLQKSNLEEAEKQMKEEIEKLQNETISDEELTQIKDYIKGTYILDHQTNSHRAYYLGWWHAMGLSSEFDTTYLNEIHNLTADQVKTAAQTYLSKPFMTIHTLPKDISQNGDHQN